MNRRVVLELGVDEAKALRTVMQEWVDFNRDIPVEDDPELPEKREIASRVLGRVAEALGGVAEGR